MRSYPKLRKTIKWGGAAITLLLVVIWAASLRWQLGWASGGNPIVITGLLSVIFAYNRIDMPPEANLQIQPGWSFVRIAGPPQWRVEHERSPRLTSLSIVILLPAAFTFAASLVVCRLDVIARRRAQPNLCHKCGYNLSGLPSVAACPECGNQRSARESR